MCISSVQSLSRVQLFETPWTAARQASLSITSSQSLLELMSIVLVMPSNHLILTCVSVFITHTRTVETMASTLQINLFCRGHAWASPTPRRRLFQGSRPRLGNRVDSQIPQLLDVCMRALSVMSDSLRPHGAHQAPLSMGILQPRILEWVAVSSSRGSSLPRDQTCVSRVSCLGRWILYQLSHQGCPLFFQGHLYA